MSFVKYPDFVTKDERGILLEIKCKVCGTPIAGMTERARTISVKGRSIDQVVLQWTRFHNFTELKMALKGGGAHITTGCNKCLTLGLSGDQLDELMEADITEQEPDLGYETAVELRARVAFAVIEVKVGGGIR